MSIAANFRAKMDVALNSADSTKGESDDHRRARLSIALDAADLILTEKAVITSLMETIEKLRAAK